jgi:hypothetical protein
MALTAAGRNFLAEAAINDSTPTFFENSNAHICVGDSTTAFAADQTDLQASSNKLRKAMDSTYPQRTNNMLTFRATFGTGDANFARQEWGVLMRRAAG